MESPRNAAEVIAAGLAFKADFALDMAQMRHLHATGMLDLEQQGYDAERSALKRNGILAGILGSMCVVMLALQQWFLFGACLAWTLTPASHARLAYRDMQAHAVEIAEWKRQIVIQARAVRIAAERKQRHISDGYHIN